VNALINIQDPRNTECFEQVHHYQLLKALRPIQLQVTIMYLTTLLLHDILLYGYFLDTSQMR